MKIKVINLLDMIARGEQAPKKIKHWKTEYQSLDDDTFIQYSNKDGYCLDLIQILNDEVEIIEEDKTIEELKIARNEKDNQMFLRVENHHATMRKIDVVFATKINELVREINKLKEN